MFRRGFAFTLLLIVSVVAPYLLSNEHNRERFAGWSKWWRSTARQFTGSGESLTADGFDTADPPISSQLRMAAGAAGPDSTLYGTAAASPEGEVVPFLGDLFRFDVTPTWVMSNWSRVTTKLFDDQLEGFRVTLLTGTGSYDLAGSLTYYFNQAQQLERITFHGFAADASALVMAVVQQYGLQAEPASGGVLYLSRWNGRATSVLRIQHAPVVHSSNLHGRVQMDLELNRPGTALSAASQPLVTQRRPLRGPR